MPLLSKRSTKKYDQIETSDDVEAPEEVINDTILLQIKLPENKIHELNLPVTTLLKDLKLKLQELTTIESSRQRIIHFGKMLTDNSKSIEEIGIKNQDFIHLMPLPKNTAPSRQTAHNPSNPIGNYEDIRNHISTDEYYELVNFNLWKARVRLLSSLFLFYYFLQSMGNISLWLHPEEMNIRFVKDFHPSKLFFTVDLIESLVGIMTALAGMKASQTDNVTNSAIFLRNCVETGIFHFISYVIYSKEVVEGKIKLNQHFHDVHEHKELEREALLFGVMFSFVINIFVWWSILTIALNYHKCLLSMYGEEGEEEEGEAEIVEGEEVV